APGDCGVAAGGGVVEVHEVDPAPVRGREPGRGPRQAEHRLGPRRRRVVTIPRMTMPFPPMTRPIRIPWKSRDASCSAPRSPAQRRISCDFRVDARLRQKCRCRLLDWYTPLFWRFTYNCRMRRVIAVVLALVVGCAVAGGRSPMSTCI